MPGVTLDPGDAAELAEMPTFLAGWLSSSQKQILTGSLAAFVGHPAYGTEALRADLHRSPSSSAKPTGKNSSVRRHHDHQHQHGTHS